MSHPPLPTTLYNQLYLPPGHPELIIPNFISLYRHLTTPTTTTTDDSNKSSTSVLDEADSSTCWKNDKLEKTGVEDELFKLRVGVARERVLIRGLREVCLSTGLGVDGKMKGKDELWYLIAMYLGESLKRVVCGGGGGARDDEEEEEEEGEKKVEMGLGNEVDGLMAGDIDEFLGKENMDLVCEVLAKYFEDVEGTLLKMVGLMTTTIDDNQHGLNKGSRMNHSRIPNKSTRHQSTNPTNFTITTNPRTYNTTTTTTTTNTPSSSTQQSLLSQLHTHLTTLTHQTTHTLPTHLTATTTLLSTLLTLQTSLLTHQIRNLELHTHSTLSRHHTTHATFLSTVSHGIALKAQITALLREKEVYAGLGVMEALRGRYDDLKREEGELERREGRGRVVLGEFERAGSIAAATGGGINEDDDRSGEENGDDQIGEGEKVMRKLGLEYLMVEEEIERVRGDIERLQLQKKQSQSGFQSRSRSRSRFRGGKGD